MVCQEVFDPRAAKKLGSRLKDKYPYQILSVGPNNRGLNSGLVAFSQFPLQQPRFYEHPVTSGMCWFAKKGTLVFQILLGNEKVVISNTHLTSFACTYKAGTDQVRTRQMTAWREEFLPSYMREMDVDPHSVVFQCGDYNSSPHSSVHWPEWPSICGEDLDLAKENPPWTTMQMGGGCFFDHIFVKNRTTVDGNFLYGNDPDCQLSDHTYVLGQFHWQLE